MDVQLSKTFKSVLIWVLGIHCKVFVIANLKVTAIIHVLQDYTDVIYRILK